MAAFWYVNHKLQDGHTIMYSTYSTMHQALQNYSIYLKLAILDAQILTSIKNYRQ